ncbi:hypothetical protein [Gordonia sp. OPL2]|uniref:hypothetical protein n=1 Tax=Gordonia sp. OPL2 TaxID=2486274 RepID=UPI00165629D9|nr:hypothetical protein [Gordonia sp. OPL2]ROZ89169.1 hypothetical protein EEB19_19035 [Gordonia sp. OPL2]
MTDDATDRGRSAEPTTDVDARLIDATFLGDVAARQLAREIPADHPFLLLELADDALRLSIVDPRFEAMMGIRSDPGIRPAVIDRLLADHLVRTGRVEQPTNEAWTAELFDLASRGRRRLATADGTFIMGREHVKFFRVALRDIDEATSAIAAGLVRQCREVVADASGPISSLVLAPGHDVWPGLAATLGRTASLPVVAVDSPAPAADDDKVPNRHDSGVEPPIAEPPTVGPPIGQSPILQPPTPAPPSFVDRESAAPEPEALDEASQPSHSGDFPAAQPDSSPMPTIGSSTVRASTPVELIPPLDLIPPMDPDWPVDDPLSENTRPVSEPLRFDEPIAMPPRPYEPVYGAGPVDPMFDPVGQPAPFGTSADADGPDDHAAPDDGPRSLVIGAMPDGTPTARRSYEPREWELDPVFTPPTTRSRSSVRTRRIVGVIVAACAIIGIGVAAAVAVTGTDEPPRPADVAVGETSTEQRPSYADPADFAEARVPAARYVPPPPPPPPPTSEESADEPTQQQNRPRPRPRPRQRTIPNPIPGLPPIVLPG